MTGSPVLSCLTPVGVMCSSHQALRGGRGCFFSSLGKTPPPQWKSLSLCQLFCQQRFEQRHVWLHSQKRGIGSGNGSHRRFLPPAWAYFSPPLSSSVHSPPLPPGPNHSALSSTFVILLCSLLPFSIQGVRVEAAGGLERVPHHQPAA